MSLGKTATPLGTIDTGLSTPAGARPLMYSRTDDPTVFVSQYTITLVSR